MVMHKANGIRKSTPRFALIFLALYLISVPLLSHMSAGASVSQALGVLSAAAFAAHILGGRAHIRVPLELILFGAFIAYTFIGGFWAVNKTTFLMNQLTLVQLWVLAILMFNLYSSSFSAHNLALKIVQWGVVGAALVAILWFDTRSGRLAGTLMNANTYGLTMLLGVAVTLMLPSRSGFARIAQLGIAAFLASQIMLSGSRKAMLGVLFLLGLYALIQLAQNMRRPLAVLALTLVITLASIGTLKWAQSTPYWQRVETFFAFARGEEVREGSINTRADMIAAGLQLWTEHPLFGVGTNQFRYYAPQFGIRETYSHSNPVEVLADFGLLGGLLYYGIYATLTWRIMTVWWRRRRLPEVGHRLLFLAGFWLAWIALETAWVTYYSKIHWIAFSLVLVSVDNAHRAARGPNRSVGTKRILA